MNRLLFNRFIIILSLLCLGTGVIYSQFEEPSLGIDDAYIFFVYGKNLSGGHGIVYNPGGERVEGYSSPLWMLTTALGYTLFGKPDIFLLCLSIILVTTAITILWHFVSGPQLLTGWGTLLIIWTFSSPSYVIWTTVTLMDTALWSSLLIIGAVIVLSNKSPQGLALIAVLIVLARPEGMVWAIALITVSFALKASQQGIKQAIQDARWPFAAYIIILVALFAGRLAYFGYLFPNTYYAKMSPDIRYNLWQGFIYLSAFINDNKHAVIFVLWPAIAGVLLNSIWLFARMIEGKNQAENQVRLHYVAISYICALGLLLPVVYGGDHFHLFRFYQATWPLLILPLFGLVNTLSLPLITRPLHATLIVLAAMLLITGPGYNWFNYTSTKYLHHEFALAAEGVTTGRILNQMFSTTLPSVGVITAGGIAVSYDGFVYDIMGLNNVEMAHAQGDRYGQKNHAAFNADVFFSQRPDIFLPFVGEHEELIERFSKIDRFYYYYKPLNGLLLDKRFRDTYSLAVISNSQGALLAYIEQGYLKELEVQGFTIVVFAHDAAVEQ